MPPRRRCRRRCWRRCGSGPSIRRATRAPGWRRSRRGGSSTPAAARPHVTAARAGVRGAAARRDRGGRRHPLPALPLLPRRPRARLPGGADPARRRRPHHPGDRRRSTCRKRRWRSGSAGPSAPWRGDANQPGDLAVVLRALPRLHGRPRGPRGPGRRGDPACPPTQPRHRRTGGARTARAGCSSTTPAFRRDSTQRVASSRSTDKDRGLWDTREIAEGRARPAGGAGRSAPRPLPGRGRHRRPARRRQAPRRPTGRRSSPGTTTSSPSPTTRFTRTPPRCSGARSRSATCSVLPPACARPTGCARCSASGTGGTPSAATCTSSAATSCRRHGVHGCRLRRLRRRRARPPSPSGPPARGPPSNAGTVVSLSVFHRPGYPPATRLRRATHRWSLQSIPRRVPTADRQPRDAVAGTVVSLPSSAFGSPKPAAGSRRDKPSRARRRSLTVRSDRQPIATTFAHAHQVPAAPAIPGRATFCFVPSGPATTQAIIAMTPTPSSPRASRREPTPCLQAATC